MYENQTHEVIRKRMLDGTSANLDKREGSLIWDATAPVSIEVELLYATIDWFLKNTFGDTAERPFLIERALERGLVPYTASNAFVKGRFVPGTITVPIGSRYSCADKVYVVKERLAAGEYLLFCEEAGTGGNRSGGKLIPINYVQGLQSAEIIELTVPAIDDEETEAFRQRYLKSFETMAYGGNVADYKEKVMSFSGVGGVKVYPVWNGGGTVKVVFCTSEFKRPTTEHIAEVQEKLDPVPFSQQGIGVAPIGHQVTVQGVTEKVINFRAKLTLRSPLTSIDIQGEANERITQYIATLNKNWKDTQQYNVKAVLNTGSVVRLARLDSILLDIDGVLDVENSTINGLNQNLTLDVDEIGVFGGATYE